MAKLTNVLTLLSVVALAGLLVIVSSAQTNAGAAGSAPVTVVNTPLPVQGTVSGNVAVTGTVNAVQSGPWSVGVTGNVPAVQSGSWNVGITGTPTVSVTGGSVSSSLPTLTRFQRFFELSLDPQSDKDYVFDTPMNLTTILVCTRDDIDVGIRTYDVQGGDTGNLLQIGKFSGPGGLSGFPCQVVTLGMQIPATGLFVRNGSIVTHATFFLIGLTTN